MYTKLASAFLVLTSIVFIAFVYQQKFKKPDIIHIHAGFLVYKDNIQVDFSKLEYMSTIPCFTDKKDGLTDENVQQEKAHLHDGIGNVVHVHISGARWGDLFANLNYPINYENATGFINQRKIINFQNKTIEPYETLVVLIGKKKDEGLKQEKIEKGYIVKVENSSEPCGL